MMACFCNRKNLFEPLGAVANAMSHATGIRFTELPLSPPRVLERITQGS